MSENWNVQPVVDSKPAAPPEKPAEQPDKDAAPAIPSVLSNDNSLGAVMTIAREARGFTRDQAAKTSNIPGYYLTMIETDDYSSIADQLYLLPFLRRYATFVALDPEEVASRFIREVQRADMNPGRVSEPIAMFEPRKPIPWGFILRTVALIAVMLGGWFGYRYYQARKMALATPPTPAASASAVPEADQAAPQAIDTAATAPANAAPAPMAIPSTAIVPEAAPSAAVAPAVVPHAAASTPAKATSKSTGHAATHRHGPFKSASNARRLSMEN